MIRETITRCVLVLGLLVGSRAWARREAQGLSRTPGNTVWSGLQGGREAGEGLLGPVLEHTDGAQSEGLDGGLSPDHPEGEKEAGGGAPQPFAWYTNPRFILCPCCHQHELLQDAEDLGSKKGIQAVCDRVDWDYIELPGTVVTFRSDNCMDRAFVAPGVMRADFGWAQLRGRLQ